MHTDAGNYVLEFDPVDLRKILDFLLVSASSDPTRVSTYGVCIEILPLEARLIGVDRARASIALVPRSALGSEKTSLFLPYVAARTLSAFLKFSLTDALSLASLPKVSVTYIPGSAAVTFCYSEYSFHVPLVTASQFPDCGFLLSSMPKNSFAVCASSLAEALSVVTKGNRKDRSVVFRFSEHGLMVYSRASQSKVIRIPVDYREQPCDFCVNADYVMDFIHLFPKKESLEVFVDSPDSRLLFRASSRPDWYYFVMPMRMA